MYPDFIKKNCLRGLILHSKKFYPFSATVPASSPAGPTSGNVVFQAPNKPFAVWYTFFYLPLCLFILGCGGFSGGDAGVGSSSDSTLVFFSGKVSFPASSSASLLKISASTQKAVTRVSRAGASMGVYLASDIYFQKNLLKPGVSVLTNEAGDFSITKSQLQDSVFTQNPKALVLAAQSNSQTITTLISVANVPENSSLILNEVSDSAWRYLKEEISQKMGNLKVGEDIKTLPFYTSFVKLADLLATHRQEILQMSHDLFQSSWFDSSIREDMRKAGQVFAAKVEELSLQDSEWSLINALGEQVQQSAIESSRTLDTSWEGKRTLQLLKTFLEYGFFVHSSQKIWFKDRMDRLQDGKIPPVFSFAPTLLDLQDIHPDISAQDLEMFPLGSQIRIVSLSELQTWGASGDAYKEKMIWIAMESQKRPWVSVRVFRSLLSRSLENLLSLRNLGVILEKYLFPQRFSVDRVQRNLPSGGLQVLGEFSPVQSFFGGRFLRSGAVSSFLTSLRFTGSSEDLWTFSSRPEIFVPVLDRFFYREFALLSARGTTIWQINNNYPDPLSQQAAKNLVYRIINSRPEWGTQSIRQEMELLQNCYLSLQISAKSDGFLDMDKPQGITTLIPAITLSSAFATPLQTDFGFYKPITGQVSGENLYLENISVSRYPISSTLLFWNEILASLERTQVSLDSTLVRTYNTLASLSRTNLSGISAPKAPGSLVGATGKVFLSRRGNTDIPAPFFVVRAFSEAGSEVATAQTDAQGVYSFPSGIPVNSFADVVVRVRNSLTSKQGTPITSLRIDLGFKHWVSGFENPSVFPDFWLEPDYKKLAANYNGDPNSIYSENSSPSVSVSKISSVVHGVIPLNLTLKDMEADFISLKFQVLIGDTNSLSLEAPKISVSALSDATFIQNGIIGPLTSLPQGRSVTLYWHSDMEAKGSGQLGDASVDNIRIAIEPFESNNQVIRGAKIYTNTFDLDNEVPVIEFYSPLRDLRVSGSVDYPEITKEVVNLQGRAGDRSWIKKIWAVNTSLSSGSITSFTARSTGSNYLSWEIENVSVEQGITNTMAFYMEDILGNVNTTPVYATFRSQDMIPPTLNLKEIRFFSPRNRPSVSASVPISITTFMDSFSYVVSVKTTASSIEIGEVTTNEVLFTGTAYDKSGVLRVRYNSRLAELVTTDQLNYTWTHREILSESENGITAVISATDRKNNDSAPASQLLAENKKYALNLTMKKVDYSAPLLAPVAGTVPLIVTTNEYMLTGSASDFSKVTGFQLCTLSCKPVYRVSVPNPVLLLDTSANPPVSHATKSLDWFVSLPILESSTNYVTGSIFDEYGFSATYTKANPYKIIKLNDITPPSMILTSANYGWPSGTMIRINSSFKAPSVATVIPVTQCSGSLCSISLSGLASDISGINTQRLLPSTTDDFQGLNFRLSSSSLFNPANSDATRNQLTGTPGMLLNQGNNFSRITTYSLGTAKIKTNVPFLAKIFLKDDGYWPLQIKLQDGSKDLHGDTHFQAPSFIKNEVLYLKKDTTPPVLSSLSVQGGNVSTSGRIVITGKADDLLSPIAKIQADSTSAQTITTRSVSSAWSKFISLDPYASVDFTLPVSVSSGSSRIVTVFVQDSFGNIVSSQLSLTVYPLYQKTIETLAQFPSPHAISFGGDYFGSVFVGDSQKQAIEEISVNGVTLTTVRGNQLGGSKMSNLSSFHGFDIFVDRTNLDNQAMLIGGIFSDGFTQSTSAEAVRLVRTKLAGKPVYVTASTLTESTVSNDYKVLRTRPESTRPDPLATGTLIRIAPLLESVVFTYKPTSTPNSFRQLVRYVDGVQETDNPQDASLGGTPRATGVFIPGSMDPWVLSSRVCAMAVTQLHDVENPTVEGVKESYEVIFLADSDLKRITRFKHKNLKNINNGGFEALLPIRLDQSPVILSPTAMDIEPSGSIAYMGSATDQRIYKLDISATSAVILTSFGGFGLTDGKFQSVDFIRGLQPPGQTGFTEIYIADKKSQRISVFTTGGIFIRHLGKNPLGLGGIQKPRLFTSSPSGFLLVDEALQAMDFYEQDIALKRLLPSSFGLTSFSSGLAVLAAPEIVFEDRTHFNNPYYLTSSSEKFRQSTSEIYYFQSPGTLIQQKHVSSTGFTRINTGSTVMTQIQESFQDSSHSFTQGRYPFTGFVSMTYVKDGDTNRIYTLEKQTPGQNDPVRVQEIPFTKGEYPPIPGILASTTNTRQSSPAGICALNSGIVLVGNNSLGTSNPKGYVQYAAFASGTKQFLNDWMFSNFILRDFLKNPMSLNFAHSVACDARRVAIADQEKIRIFSLGAQSQSTGFDLIQQIDWINPRGSQDASNRLSAPFSMIFSGSSLYALEKGRKRIQKFDLGYY